jgi:hypothetical protein
MPLRRKMNSSVHKAVGFVLVKLRMEWYGGRSFALPRLQAIMLPCQRIALWNLGLFVCFLVHLLYQSRLEDPTRI